jgi:hypothetical protein
VGLGAEWDGETTLNMIEWLNDWMIQ